MFLTGLNAWFMLRAAGGGSLCKRDICGTTACMEPRLEEQIASADATELF